MLDKQQQSGSAVSITVSLEKNTINATAVGCLPLDPVSLWSILAATGDERSWQAVQEGVKGYFQPLWQSELIIRAEASAAGAVGCRQAEAIAYVCCALLSPSLRSYDRLPSVLLLLQRAGQYFVSRIASSCHSAVGG
jgi:hypothetical protein